MGWRGEGEFRLKGRCDSFVVETDVHYPTDINLLLDASARWCFSLVGLVISWVSPIGGSIAYFQKDPEAIQRGAPAQTFIIKGGCEKGSTEQLIIEAHRQYIDLVDHYVQRVQAGLGVLKVLDRGTMARMMVIDEYIAHAERQIDQIRRRVLEGETIAHQEKVFSIFEAHTEWISKGKAGVSQELGLGVCVLG